MKDLKKYSKAARLYLKSIFLIPFKPRKIFQDIAKDNNQIIALILVWASGFSISQLIVFVFLPCNQFEDFLFHWVGVPILTLVLFYFLGFLIYKAGVLNGGKAKFGQIRIVLAWAGVPWIWIISIWIWSPWFQLLLGSIFYIFVIWELLLLSIGISVVQKFSFWKATWHVFLASVLATIPLMAVWIGLGLLKSFFFENK